jgi:hypothetical protein
MTALIALSLLCAAPEGLEKKVTLEFRDISARQLVTTLAEVSQEPLLIGDEFAERKVSLRLRNVSVRTVLEALATQLQARVIPVGERSLLVQALSSSRSSDSQVKSLEQQLATLQEETARVEAELRRAREAQPR